MYQEEVLCGLLVGKQHIAIGRFSDSKDLDKAAVIYFRFAFDESRVFNCVLQ